MKRLTLWIGLIAIAGCGRVHTEGPVEVVYWTGWSGDEFKIQKQLVEKFNSTHPHIRVRIVCQFGNAGYEKVRIAIAGNATPDVMSTVWADELAGYAKRGVLLPLDELMARSGRSLEKEFTPGLRKSLRIDGKVYALAVTTNTSFIVYNKQIFRELGLDPDRPPRTVEELDRASDASVSMRKDGAIQRFGYVPNNLLTWVYVFGGRWYDPKADRVTANDPRNVAALKWMADYYRRFDSQAVRRFQSTFGNDATAQMPFFQGLISMWATGEWASAFLKRYAPDIEYGYFPLPIPKGGNPETTYCNGSVFVIPKASRHVREAWEFLNWLTSPEQVAYFCSKIGNVPPLLEVGDDPAFLSDPIMRFAVRLTRSEKAVGPPPIAIWPTYTREIARAEEAVLAGRRDPKVVLDNLQARMEKEYRRSKAELGQ